MDPGQGTSLGGREESWGWGWGKGRSLLESSLVCRCFLLQWGALEAAEESHHARSAGPGHGEARRRGADPGGGPASGGGDPGDERSGRLGQQPVPVWESLPSGAGLGTLVTPPLSSTCRLCPAVSLRVSVSLMLSHHIPSTSSLPLFLLSFSPLSLPLSLSLSPCLSLSFPVCVSLCVSFPDWVCLPVSLSLSVYLSLSVCLSLTLHAHTWPPLLLCGSALPVPITNALPAFLYPGRPLDPSLLLAQATSNIICSLIFGRRFPYDNEEFQAVVRAAGGTVVGVSSPWGQTYEMFSRLLQFLPGPHTQLLGHLGTLAAFAVQQVQEHRENLDASGPARDVVEAFLLKMAKEKQDPQREFTDKDLLMTVIYLLFAGTVTISTTIRYTLLLLLKYPRVQERVREELTRELGAGQVPGLGDRARLPYTDAVLHEAQRLLALVPMGVPRAVTKTTRFRGYTLPQGTEVFPLLGSILHDPEIFEQPEEFNPGRFLDADGKFQKQAAFLPFSLGKRVCLGEGLARAELFLLFAAILQAFSLEGPSPPGALSLQPAISGLFNIPQAFQLQFRPC
uniref:Cytochrome P450 n=1 Tax=Sus scrofa TaxID=9823 RepID=A0A8D1Q6H2_PIG